MFSVSLLATLVATLLGFVLGALWYGPLFGKSWMAENNLTEEQIRKDFSPVKTYGTTFVLGFCSAYLFGFVIGPDPELASAVGAGVLIGALWVAGAVATHYLFEGKSFRHFVINGGYDVVRFALIGLAFGVLA
jgi:hypothetical protein